MKYLELLRIRHWVKNLFVFIPFLVTGKFLVLNNLYEGFKVFFFFCIAASLVYSVNDYKDIQNDRLHPVKKNRPLAKGVVSKSELALIFLVLIFLLSYPLYVLSRESMPIIYAYIILNIIYTFWAKKISILDIIFISSGFVLRVLAGVVVLQLVASPWIIILTFSISMLLALGKRKGELITMMGHENKRLSLKGYTIEAINAMQIIFSCIAIIIYSMYTFFNDNFPGNKEYLIYSLLPVIFGVLRYLQISFSGKHIEEPTNILYQDRKILISILLWIVYIIVLIIYN